MSSRTTFRVVRSDGIQLNKDQCYSTGSHRLDPILKSPIKTRDDTLYMPQKIYDTIIIGSGPAGMTAGIYAARKEMSVLVLGKDVGGQMAKILVVENSPGIESTDGISIAFKIQEQAKFFGVEFEIDEIISIQKKDKIFEVLSKEKKYQAKSIILAFGLEKRKLNLDSEEKFLGKGLSYCVTCDGPLMKNKNVAVVGGGNAGAEAVEYMAKVCPQVYWLKITDQLRADEILIERIKKLDNVKILTSIKVTDFFGQDQLQGIKVKNKDRIELAVQGVIVEIGYVSKTDWLEDLVELDKFGQIKVNELCHTNIPGIFAAGDVTNTKYKQIVVAQGMGAVAALEAYNYVSNF
ncbi:FAD-dependent oxidoreductase [Candidatus Parcubacteria bacterium]|nr:FAD-dependent oxidoreductase [Candidatus Parcubacteria bacterium]